MNASESPFKALWWSTDLGNFRSCDSTYCAFDYDALPNLDMNLFRGDFQWLEQLDEEKQADLAIYQRPEAREQLSKNLKLLEAEAVGLGLKLPPEFIKFMSSLELQDQIPSSTACFFALEDKIIANPLEDDGYFITFLYDQQSVLIWYLYLKTDGRQAVLVSPIDMVYDDISPSAISEEIFLNNVHFCGESFESFLYRFWIENCIWFGFEDGTEQNPAQKAYLQHYQNKI